MYLRETLHAEWKKLVGKRELPAPSQAGCLAEVNQSPLASDIESLVFQTLMLKFMPLRAGLALVLGKLKSI